MAVVRCRQSGGYPRGSRWRHHLPRTHWLWNTGDWQTDWRYNRPLDSGRHSSWWRCSLTPYGLLRWPIGRGKGIEYWRYRKWRIGSLGWKRLADARNIDSWMEQRPICILRCVQRCQWNLCRYKQGGLHVELELWSAGLRLKPRWNAFSSSLFYS